MKFKVPKGTKILQSCHVTDTKYCNEIIVPEGIAVIDAHLFSGCWVNTLVLPKTLKKIGAFAFHECRYLKSVILPEGLEAVDEFAFNGCYGLEYVFLPASLKKIGKRAFDTQYVDTWYEKTPTGKIKIRNGQSVTHSIKYESKIKRIILPASLEKIGENAFGDKTYLYRDKDKLTYFVPKNSAAEKFALEQGYMIIQADPVHGALIGPPISDSTLCYTKEDNKSATIPVTINKIAEYAFFNCEKIEEISIPASVIEISANAFSGCTKLSSLIFSGKPKLQKIGSKAFGSFVGKTVDLPESVVEISKDSFPKGCIVSINGEMPFYADRLAKNKEQKSKIDAKEQRVLELESQYKEIEEALGKHLASLPTGSEDIPGLKEEICSIERARDVEDSFNKDEKSYLNKRLQEIENKIKLLQAERKNCFFLAFTKKRELEEDIARAQGELQSVRDDLQRLGDKVRRDAKHFADLIAPVQRKLDALLDEQARWEKGKRSLTEKKAGLRKEIKSLSEEIAEWSESLKKDEEALEKEHEKWLKAKEKTLRLIEQEKKEAEEQKRIEKLRTEKKRILSELCIPSCSVIPLFEYQPRNTVVEESLLNEAFLTMITELNGAEREKALNRYVKSQAAKIARVKEINALMGCDEEDGVAAYQELPVRKVLKTYLPERVAVLAKCFAESRHWSGFKKAVADIQVGNSVGDHIQNRFFKELDYFALENEGRYLLIFPYFMVLFKQGTPMTVLTYDTAKATVTYVDKEEIREDIPPYGELLYERHRHLNADGSISRRYKDNPIVKTIRYTTITVGDESQSATVPVGTLNGAMQLEDAFNGYSKALTTGLMGDVYTKVTSSANYREIITALAHLEEEEARLLELERQKAAAERKRLEEERIALEAAAAQRRRELIQRQRELNEEQRRREREALRLFEDDFTVREEPLTEEDTATGVAYFSVSGNTTISNNVFKVTLAQSKEGVTGEHVAYFVSVDDEVISNRKKLMCDGVGCETTVGFVLDSGIDFTKMKRCFMRIESLGEIVQNIEFKMNIAFYSDF